MLGASMTNLVQMEADVYAHIKASKTSIYQSMYPVHVPIVPNTGF